MDSKSTFYRLIDNNEINAKNIDLPCKVRYKQELNLKYLLLIKTIEKDIFMMILSILYFLLFK